MKYQGKVEEVKSIQDAMLRTDLCYVNKKTGHAGGFGIEPSSLYSVRLTLMDRYFNGYSFFVSFNYRYRDDYGEMWIEDKHVGRMIKVFPQIFNMFGKLTPIVLKEKEANIVREEYQMKEILRSEA